MPPSQGVNIEALLSRVPLFNDLEADEVARIARGTREINALRGDILFHKGDSPTGFYLIVYGQVKLAFTSSQGGEKVVDLSLIHISSSSSANDGNADPQPQKRPPRQRQRFAGL